MGGAMEGGAASKRGIKRLADESNLSDDQRFTKRFNLLNLGPTSSGNSNYYIPVSSPPIANRQSVSASRPDLPAQHGPDDSMHVDDTPERVYVHDLDAELAEIEAHEPDQRLIFLPDIEKHFSPVPKHLLAQRRGSVDSNHEDQQLVLYEVPKSLTVADEGSDSVRKAIIEARQRTRDRAAEQARQEEMERKYGRNDECQSVETAHGYSSGYEDMAEPDPDAMDIE